MTGGTERLDVRGFPADIKRWAEKADLNLSEETRKMWHARMHGATTPGHAALRSEIEELERLAEYHDDRADDLREKAAELREREDIVFRESDDAETRTFEEWVAEKGVLVQDASNPAILDAADVYGKTPEQVVEALREEHPPDPNPLGLKSLTPTGDGT